MSRRRRRNEGETALAVIPQATSRRGGMGTKGWIGIGAGVLAVGGLGWWFFSRRKAAEAEAEAAAAAAAAAALQPPPPDQRTLDARARQTIVLAETAKVVEASLMSDAPKSGPAAEKAKWRLALLSRMNKMTADARKANPKCMAQTTDARNGPWFDMRIAFTDPNVDKAWNSSLKPLNPAHPLAWADIRAVDAALKNNAFSYGCVNQATGAPAPVAGFGGFSGIFDAPAFSQAAFGMPVFSSPTIPTIAAGRLGPAFDIRPTPAGFPGASVNGWR